MSLSQNVNFSLEILMQAVTYNDEIMTFHNLSEGLKTSWIHFVPLPFLILIQIFFSLSLDSSSESFSLPSIQVSNCTLLPFLTERHHYPEAAAGFAATLCS